MKNKKISLIIILIIYVLSIISGYFACLIFKDKYHPITVMLIADIIATIVVYISSLIFKNSSVYDPYWSVIPVFVVLGYFVIYDISFDMKYLIVLIPFLFWAVRLTINWAVGFDNLLWQDWRYVGFKNKFPRIFQLINFTGIMLMPTLLVFAGTIPFYFLITEAYNVIFLIIGGIIITLATILQMVADIQMKKFKKNNTIKGACIDEGVWRYTRHPNYFAEVMIWWGVLIATLPNNNPITIIGAILITLLFMFISIPLMEKHILETRPSYHEYKNKVRSSLIPFYRKDKE